MIEKCLNSAYEHLNIEIARQPGSFSMKEEHFHDTWEIYYLISGERIYFIKDKTYHIHEGDLVLIPENVLHKTSGAGKLSQPHERILVNFGKGAVVGLAPERDAGINRLFDSFPVLHLDAEERNAVRSILARMLAEQQEEKPCHAEYLKLLFSELVLILLRFAAHRHVSPEQPETGGYPHREITEVSQYINAHCEEKLTLRELAARFHISPYYLSHIFPKVTGLTLVAYINRVRIERACELLRETGLPITDIAYSVGYQSVTHFGRTFRKSKGTSPQNYRREQQVFR